MAGAVDISLGDLNDRFTAKYVTQVFCDNGSNQPGSRVYPAISAARRIADAILLKAWTAAQIEILVAEDDAIRAAILDIALSEGMAGRPQWDTPDGPRYRMKKSAIENLSLLAQGHLRSVGEAAGAGRNPHTRSGRVNTERTPHTFVFAPSRSKPTRGGF